MKVSIITVVRNNEETIKDAIDSVLSQTYDNREYIIIDGASTDGTVEIIRSYGDKISKFVSESDKGIYEGMNKGLKEATGDIIGILNSDDFYANEQIIENIVKIMEESSVDSCYGDILYVDRSNLDKIVRVWKAGNFDRTKFRYGWMPPHPSFFCKRVIFEKYGYMNTDFPLAADYELMLRFLYKYNVSTVYIPEVIVKMRAGGTSRIGKYTIGAIRENYLAWKVNGLNYPVTMLFKPFSKIGQLFKRRFICLY